MHYRAGLMDGVSLEMEKWKRVLTNMGHEVKIVGGNVASGVDLTIKELGFEDEYYQFVNANAFEKLETPKEKLLSVVEEKAREIEKRLREVLFSFDLIIPNNVWSLGAYLPTAVALTRYARKSEKQFIAHHHDFWWEREYYLSPTLPEIKKLLIENCPPILKNVKHVVINSFAKDELKKRKGIDAFVVPNVMNFDEPFIVDDSINDELRKKFSFEKGDVVLLQATRITRRKAIETAIDLVKIIKEMVKKKKGIPLYNGYIFTGRVVLAFSGMCEDTQYKHELRLYAEKNDVETIDMYKAVEKEETSFLNLYSVADIVTYPSILEGWGNQLLEALVAKKPVVLFEYEVFKRDIKKSGINEISLGDFYETVGNFVKVRKENLEEAAKRCTHVLFDKTEYRRVVESNFEIAKKNFGYSALREALVQILS